MLSLKRRKNANMNYFTSSKGNLYNLDFVFLTKHAFKKLYRIF